MKRKYVAIVFILFGMHFTTHAQEANHVQTESHHPMKGAHRLAFGLGHTSVSEGQVDGKTQWLPLASWSINYDYWISDKWAVGLQNDWILETFKVESHEGEIIERKNPIAVVPVGMYKFARRFTAIGGVGVEFSHGHNLTMTRIGLEYGWHLPNNWEAGMALVWDNKWNYYNSWGVAFTFSKIWPKKHH
jgi:hypothetical protein